MSKQMLAAAAAAVILAAPLAGCSSSSEQSYDSGVKAQQSQAAAKLDEAIEVQKKSLADRPWASSVTQTQLDSSGTKLYVMTTLEKSGSGPATALEVCRSYAPAVANFPDITLLIVGDKTNTEIARCSVQRMTAQPGASASSVPTPQASASK